VTPTSSLSADSSSHSLLVRPIHLPHHARAVEPEVLRTPASSSLGLLVPNLRYSPTSNRSTSFSVVPIPSLPSPPHARTHVLLPAWCPAAERILPASSFSRSPPQPIVAARPVPDNDDLPPSSSSYHGMLPCTVLGGFRWPTHLHKFCYVQLASLQLMDVSPLVHISYRSTAENWEGGGKESCRWGLPIDSIACLR
jgi:hypothetical protein